jgi:hypothetical protein
MALMEVFPGSKQVGSLNADDIAELIEDRTDGYVLCRACGVREAGLQIHVFDPALQAFARAELVPAPASVKPAGKGDELAGSAGTGDGEASDGASTDGSSNDTSGMAADEDLPTPSIQVMHRLFYGEYAAVLEQMRQYPAAKHFGAAPPLLDENMSDEQLDRIIEETFIRQIAFLLVHDLRK